MMAAPEGYIIVPVVQLDPEYLRNLQWPPSDHYAYSTQSTKEDPDQTAAGPGTPGKYRSRFPWWSVVCACSALSSLESPSC